MTDQPFDVGRIARTARLRASDVHKILAGAPGAFLTADQVRLVRALAAAAIAKLPPSQRVRRVDPRELRASDSDAHSFGATLDRLDRGRP
jgi:hypothetical protein